MSEITLFISYSHDSDAHRERVLRLSERLRADGIATILDQYGETSPPHPHPRRPRRQVDRLDRPEDGVQLRPGEILVTAQANVGWTLLFPRAAAVVTDVGAPLSHAAIVARELGIPAAVGRGNATTLLKTGDCVRMDSGRAMVEILTQ
jgi:phosphohistidine swiveling domain-containing protein